MNYNEPLPRDHVDLFPIEPDLGVPLACTYCGETATTADCSFYYHPNDPPVDIYWLETYEPNNTRPYAEAFCLGCMPYATGDFT